MPGTLVKRVYVDAATRHFVLPDRELSDSRVAMLIGLHRKDVSLLRHRPQEAETRPSTLSAGVLRCWLAHPNSSDATGLRMTLPRAAETGPSSEALFVIISLAINTYLPPHLRDVCSILAAGLVRLRSRAAEEAAREAADLGERALPFSAPQRPYANRTNRRPA